MSTLSFAETFFNAFQLTQGSSKKPWRNKQATGTVKVIYLQNE